MNIPVQLPSKNKAKSKSQSQARKLWNENGFPRPLGWRMPFVDFPSFDAMFHDEEVSWIPRSDCSETDKEIKIKIDIPNVDPEKISVEVDDHSLQVSGYTEKEDQEEGETWYRAERSWGEFKRVFSLPNNADADKIKASTKNGTLSITVPKLKSSLRKKIDVEKK